MALGAALVDRARRVTKEASTVRVEGTTPMAEVRSAWFRCRLFLGGDRESQGEDGSYVRSVRGPTLLYGVRDADGAVLDVGYDEKLEVESAQLGDALWRVAGEPEPLRKRRTVIGYQVTLERVQEREFVKVDV